MKGLVFLKLLGLSAIVALAFFSFASFGAPTAFAGDPAETLAAWEADLADEMADFHEDVMQAEAEMDAEEVADLHEDFMDEQADHADRVADLEAEAAEDAAEEEAVEEEAVEEEFDEED